MSSRGSLLDPDDMADELVADNFRSSSSSLLLLFVELRLLQCTLSSSPHNLFISSSTRKKSSSLAEAIEHAIKTTNLN